MAYNEDEQYVTRGTRSRQRRVIDDKVKEDIEMKEEEESPSKDKDQSTRRQGRTRGSKGTSAVKDDVEVMGERVKKRMKIDHDE